MDRRPAKQFPLPPRTVLTVIPIAGTRDLADRFVSRNFDSPLSTRAIKEAPPTLIAS